VTDALLDAGGAWKESNATAAATTSNLVDQTKARFIVNSSDFDAIRSLGVELDAFLQAIVPGATASRAAAFIGEMPEGRCPFQILFGLMYADIRAN
jgi:hypothetical protein